MKINLKKLETAFPQQSASKFPFSAVSILSPLFIHFSNTASCHWLSVNKFQWKMKPSFELGTLRWLDTVFQGQYLPCVSINYVAINKDLEKLTPQLYQIKMKICYDQGCNDIGVSCTTIASIFAYVKCIVSYCCSRENETWRQCLE